ncbi:MAG: Fe-S cluster assembly ATPase SufC [Nanoarchaeota archaeon]
MKNLKIENLEINVGGKEIVKGVSLEVKSGEIVALLGPNGSGKSTVAFTLAGHPNYTIKSGKILLNGEDITEMSPDKRAKRGLFLGFQHPVEISGVTVANFLRLAVKAKTGKEIDVLNFFSELKEKMKEIKMDESFATRYLNEGFSGGEKKKMEVLQMHILKPEFAVLDEVDSGTDQQAIKEIANSLNEIIKRDKIGVLLISHYQKFLHYLKPDRVLVMKDGKIIKEGGFNIVDQIEKEGFDGVG